MKNDQNADQNAWAFRSYYHKKKSEEREGHTWHFTHSSLIWFLKEKDQSEDIVFFFSHLIVFFLSFSFFLRAIKRKIKEKDGEESRRGIRLPVQGSINRRLRSRKIEPPLPIYSQRVLFGVQVHHWRRIRYSHSSSYYYLTLSLSIYSLLHFAWSTSILNVLLLLWFFICNSQLSLVRSR